MSEIEILSQFKQQLVSFFDELIAMFPNEGDFIIMRLFLANNIPIKDVMNIFILRINQNVNNFVRQTLFDKHK
jgi:hypothetical protein